MALATGHVASGALGHSTGNPTLLGDTANLVFRLEKLIGADRPGDIFVEKSTFESACKHPDAKDCLKFSYVGEFNVQGRQRPVAVHSLSKGRKFNK